MKMTIEPTNKDSDQRKVVIETENDDLDFGELYEIFKSISVAYGYHPETVNEYFDKEH